MWSNSSNVEVSFIFGAKFGDFSFLKTWVCLFITPKFAGCMIQFDEHLPRMLGSIKQFGVKKSCSAMKSLDGGTSRAFFVFYR